LFGSALSRAKDAERSVPVVDVCADSGIAMENWSARIATGIFMTFIEIS
jgi:hypothetical protein